jgi:hypothetical protein
MLRKYEFHFPLPTLSQQTISEVLTIAGPDNGESRLETWQE